MKLFVDAYGELCAAPSAPLAGTFACSGGVGAMGLENRKEYLFEVVPEGGDFYLKVNWYDDWIAQGRLYRGDELIYRFDGVYTGLYDFLADNEYESVSFNVSEVETSEAEK